MKKTQPTEAEIDAAMPHIMEAAQHLARCWDALHKAEEVTGREIDTDALSDIAFGMDAPSYCLGQDMTAEWIGNLLKDCGPL